MRVVVATHRNLEELVKAGDVSRGPLPPHLCVSDRAAAAARPPETFPFWPSISCGSSTNGTAGSRSGFRPRHSRSWKIFLAGKRARIAKRVERVLLLATGDTVEPETVARALPQALTTTVAHDGALSAAAATGPLATRVEVFERETLLAVLKQHHHHMTNTAKALGLERSHLYKKCQQLGIDLRSLRQTD